MWKKSASNHLGKHLLAPPPRHNRQCPYMETKISKTNHRILFKWSLATTMGSDARPESVFLFSSDATASVSAGCVIILINIIIITINIIIIINIIVNIIIIITRPKRASRFAPPMLSSEVIIFRDRQTNTHFIIIYIYHQHHHHWSRSYIFNRGLVVDSNDHWSLCDQGWQRRSLWLRSLLLRTQGIPVRFRIPPFLHCSFAYSEILSMHSCTTYITCITFCFAQLQEQLLLALERRGGTEVWW